LRPISDGSEEVMKLIRARELLGRDVFAGKRPQKS
jgi:hypothetical protein